MTTSEPRSATASTTDPLDNAIARQERVLDLQLQWITAVDAKTPIIIGLATTMLASLCAIAPPRREIEWLDGVLLVVGAWPLATSLYHCMKATTPRTDGPSGSLIYFGGIADLAPSQYTEQVQGRSGAEYLSDLCRQVHRNAQIASAKFMSVQRATMWLFGGTGPWLIAVYFLYKG